MCSLPFPSFLPLETVPPPPNPTYSIRLKSGRVRVTGLAFGMQPRVLKRTLDIRLPASPIAWIPFGFRFAVQERVNDTEQMESFGGRMSSHLRASHTLGRAAHSRDEYFLYLLASRRCVSLQIHFFSKCSLFFFLWHVEIKKYNINNLHSLLGTFIPP